MKHFVLFIGMALTVLACSKEWASTKSEAPQLPTTVFDYTVKLPAGVHSSNSLIDFSPINNMTFVSNEGATLGRVLFYDKKLSLNNSVSCGSCHHQDKAFADGKTVSPGFEGKLTNRNSMAIINPIVQNNLFWDSRSFSISDLSLKPVQNHLEMGMEDMVYLVDKLSKEDYYKPLFSAAFNGSEEITEQKISEALSQFVASITTSQSKFDEGLVTNFINFSDLEKMGMNIFNSSKSKCSTCHTGNNFSVDDNPGGEYGDDAFGSNSSSGPKGTTNIGLDLVYADNGRESGKFKIPSLRNIALTGPYMHDGRFRTLEEVIDHYSHGIKSHKDLDKKFKDASGNPIKFNFNDAEKYALVAFLNTLSDYSMIKDVKYSDPFKQ